MKYSLKLFNLAQAIKPHVPSIKFRRAVLDLPNVVQPALSKATPTSTGGNSYVIDERHLPSRFRRPTLDEKEINLINSGGAL